MHVILLSKDMLPARTLPVYGNRRYDTPNIDRLARAGTVFEACISPCPSSAMSYSCIMTGQQPYDLASIDPQPSNHSRQSLFSAFETRGFGTHVVWDQAWTKASSGSLHKLPIYGQDTRFHNLDLDAPITTYARRPRRLAAATAPATGSPADDILDTLARITDSGSDTFTWLHCPHVFKGFAAIGSDMAYFDGLVGRVVELLGSDNLFLTSDHGHMEFRHGEVMYGKAMNEAVLHVPLIVPPLDGVPGKISEPFSNIRLRELVTERRVVLDSHVFSVNQLLMEPGRVLTIRSGRYKYWFCQDGAAEALYDLEVDPEENCNLLLELVYSPSKKKYAPMERLLDYDGWEDARQAYQDIAEQRREVWRRPSLRQRGYGRLRYWARHGVWTCLRDRCFPRQHLPGRWGARAVTGQFRP